MPSFTRALKCLIWLTAALASLQAFQGFPVACHFGICHAANEMGSQVCCNKRVALSDSHRDTSRDDDLVELGAPGAPCECPTNCWCRLPLRALLQICELTPLATGGDLDVSWSPVAETNGLRPAIAAAPTIPKSSQQVCAVLCRFLA